MHSFLSNSMVQLRKLLIPILLVFVISNVQAQESFQRLYTTQDHDLITLGIEPASNGGFYVLNAILETGLQTGPNAILLSKHDQKGSLDWANEYSATELNIPESMLVNSLNRLDNDTLVIVASNYSESEMELMNERYVIKIEPVNGNLVSVNKITNIEDVAPSSSKSLVLNAFDSDYTYFGSHSNQDTFGLQRILFDANDTIISQQGLYAVNQDQTPGYSIVSDALATPDSNYVLGLITELDSAGIALLKMSPDGNLIATESFRISPDSLGAYQFRNLDMAVTPDSGIVIAAEIVVRSSSTVRNFVIKTDSLCQLQWSMAIDDEELNRMSLINDIIVSSQEEIVLTGKYFNPMTSASGDFSLILDGDGNVVRQWDYASDYSSFFVLTSEGLQDYSTNGELVNIIDGGMAYATVGFDQLEFRTYPYIIKMDSIGGAFCQDTLSGLTTLSFAFVEDTLLMDFSDFTEIDTFQMNEDSYNGFTIPVLQLLDTFFCPQDPIFVTLDAALEGAVMYEWSTGESSPAIDVTEEGEYSVTVTFDDKICYTLCDTSNITQRQFPEATIDARYFGECEVDSVLLTAGANNPIVSLAWSTGDSISRTISVMEAGLYSVTIVDFCGNEASAEINISDDVINGSPNIIDIVPSGRNCNGVVLNPIVVGVTDNLSYLWEPSGSTDESLLVTENGTVTLTVENDCGNTDTESFNVDNLDTLSVQIFPEGECNDLELTAFVPPGSFVGMVDYLWSDGSTSNVLSNLPGAGVYSVTVTDDCDDNEVSASFAISDTLAFPSMFFPSGPQNTENGSFGPYIACPDFFEGTNYILEIYNRFGNKVFESTNVSTRWNGQYDGEVSPTDVYMYQWSYSTPDGESVEGEGTISLLR